MIAAALIIGWAAIALLRRPGRSRALSWLAGALGVYVALRVSACAGAEWARGGGP